MMDKRRFGRYTVETSREEKVLFPKTGYTKADLLEYYTKVWDHVSPYLKDRPLSLRRFPDGIGKRGFFQKQAADYYPGWITTIRVKKRAGGKQDLVVADKIATLAYLADQACITLHGWLSRKDKLDKPDMLLIDLDPSGDDFTPVRTAALRCRDLLDDLDIRPFVKTTGSRGLHVVVPLARTDSFDAVRDFASRLAEVLVEKFPDELTTEKRKNKRGNKIFLDVARNAYAQTAVLPFCVRSREGAPVSVPVRWDEVKKSRLKPDGFTIKNIFHRLSRTRDPWVDFRRHRHSIKKAAARLKKFE